MICRLIVDEPAGGDWNMAVDETLLEAAAENGYCVLRFYRWLAPTLSLGYFQHAADRRKHPASLHCPLVRRASGGGAILHDRELTYSLAVPPEHRLAANPLGLYRAVHQSLVAVLSPLLGPAVSLRKVAGKEAPATEPFLCFLRRSVGDVLFEQAKIAGSAQRRRRGAVLQHGSLILDTSLAAPDVPGIGPLSGVDLSCGQLVALWPPRLVEDLGLKLQESCLKPEEFGRADTLLRVRYSSAQWNGGS